MARSDAPDVEFTKVEKDQDIPSDEVDNTVDNTPYDEDEDEIEEDEATEEESPGVDASKKSSEFFTQLGAIAFGNPAAMAELSKGMGNQAGSEKEIPTPDFAVTQEVYDDMTEAEQHLYAGLWRMHEKNVRLERQVQEGQNMTLFQQQTQELKSKFGDDVDVNKVLQYATNRRISNLEDAYKAMSYAPSEEAGNMKQHRNNKSMQTVTGSKHRGGGGKSKPVQLSRDQRKVLASLNDAGANISEQRYAVRAQEIAKEHAAGTYGRAGAGKINYTTIKG